MIDGVSWTHAYSAEGDEYLALGEHSGTVDAIPDEVGTDDLAQGTGTQEPQALINVGIGERNLWRFDGGDDHIEATFAASVTRPYTWVVIGASRDASPGSLEPLIGQSANRSPLAVKGGGADWRLRLSGTNLDVGTPDEDLHLFRSLGSTTGNCELWVDETSQGTGGGNADAVAGLSMASYIGGAVPTPVDIYFVGLFEGADITTDPGWTQFKADVTSLFGITLA